MYDFEIQVILSFIGPFKYMYFRINKQWSNAYKTMYDSEVSQVDLDSISCISYALNMGYVPSNYAIIYAAVNGSYEILEFVCKSYKAKNNTILIPSFTLALCSDNEVASGYFIQNEFPSIEQFFRNARRNSIIDIYRDALQTICSKIVIFSNFSKNISNMLLDLDCETFKLCFNPVFVDEDFIAKAKVVNFQIYKYIIKKLYFK